jgi:hypothetical protein
LQKGIALSYIPTVQPLTHKITWKTLNAYQTANIPELEELVITLRDQAKAQGEPRPYRLRLATGCMQLQVGTVEPKPAPTPEQVQRELVMLQKRIKSLENTPA